MNFKSRRIRVLVADDSHTALVSLCRYLEFEGGFEIVGTAGDGIHLLQQAERLHKALPKSHLTVLPKTGHQIPFTHPQAVVDEIERMQRLSRVRTVPS